MSRNYPMEVEGKYRVQDANRLEALLAECGAEFDREEVHCDTYLRHPCRDFRVTDEALRVRKVNGEPWLTYKGPRCEGSLKVRPEIELPLSSEHLEPWMEIWRSLGFERVHEVSKRRRVFRWSQAGRSLTVTVDHVDRLGTFAEIERIVHSEDEMAAARSDIETLSLRLGLDQVEKRSYLSMVLELDR